MLRPSRDWRESMTLSSRDPHFGQRIVSEHSLSHNPLWRQSFRFRGAATRESSSGAKSRSPRHETSAVAPSDPNDRARDDIAPRPQWLRRGSFGRRDFLFRLRLLRFKLEANLSVLQLQISGEGTSLF